MITKQETFKRLLANYYKSINRLDKELWETMKRKFYWSFALTSEGEATAFKSVNGDFYKKNIYENSLEWHNDLRSCLKILGRI